MADHLRKHYFVIVKALGVLALAISGTMGFIGDTDRAGLVFLASAIFLFCTVFTELSGGNGRRVALAAEVIASLGSFFLSPLIGVCYMAISYLDVVAELGIAFYVGVLALLFLRSFREIDMMISIAVMLFLIVIYYQHYKIIRRYETDYRDNILQESKLKSDIAHSQLAYKAELNKSRLQHENELLEEKSRISQALHDKLGHSINGSIYQLEAAKVLIEKDPDKSISILQAVIDNMRGSMDEIRVIIRNERPDRKRIALKSMQALLEECEEKYDIKTTLQVSEDNDKIPESIWEIILDNTFEAVTNALKYSSCSEIAITITLLGEVVRVTIKDNGRGAPSGFEDGMGIQGMKNRVRKVRGYLDIESENGFAINMILPVRMAQKEETDGAD